MTAAVKNITIEQKATFLWRLTYKDRFKKPVNLTGWTARMQIRDAAGALICDLSTENGRITLGGVTGVVNLRIEAADTAAMTFKVAALYDLKLVAADGFTEYRLLEGKVNLSPGQTDIAGTEG